ncbi:hypothetical protein [Nonomuraea sp. NPDC049400]|uniref:hypothetical protein n=1 Tax=Nonomuraea sp. NPDC049400 TaxID=3364352 RepID=UPI0037A55753
MTITFDEYGERELRIVQAAPTPRGFVVHGETLARPHFQVVYIQTEDMPQELTIYDGDNSWYRSNQGFFQRSTGGTPEPGSSPRSS